MTTSVQKESKSIRETVGMISTHIPEGLSLPYFTSLNVSGVHLLILVPKEGSIWWRLGVNIKAVVRSIRLQVSGNCNEIVPEHIAKSLKDNECKVYLWKPNSPREGAMVNATLDKLQPTISTVKKKVEVVMESWAVKLKEHPEFTCIINLAPGMFLDVEKTVVSRAIKTWKRILREAESDVNRKKAHCQYARRNADKLMDRGNYEASKVASYSSRAVFAKYRVSPSSDWVTPSKVLPKETRCQNYNHSGLIKEELEVA